MINKYIENKKDFYPDNFFIIKVVSSNAFKLALGARVIYFRFPLKNTIASNKKESLTI